MTESTASPWYRHRWPWLLMAGPFVVVVAGISMAVVAYRGADGVVADDYYKRGLAINRTLAREARAEAIGLQADVALREGRAVAHIAATGPLPDRIQLTLAHPTRAGEDRVVSLARTPQGTWEAPLPPLAHGRWRLILETPEWRWSALAQAAG
ncbi:FixH family protein [Usitatibacter palustris]|uniref:Nitrogen fixation protein FixH n=1 Tax=Usitatibacter palustris TaxID=2732487 RepID=A0A6M4H5K7_9PROT|nr:FixH family protein [Usitatibacter palustris]QJR14228.1 hypothetical protein DSM104440_01021 [Usitatibacter palustris]